MGGKQVCYRWDGRSLAKYKKDNEILENPPESTNNRHVKATIKSVMLLLMCLLRLK